MKRYVIQDSESGKYLLDEGGKYILSSTVGNFLTGEGYVAAILKDAKKELNNNNLTVIEFELPPIEP
jgi:hypothetical protein